MQPIIKQGVESVFRRPVIPVLTVPRAEQAVALADALAAGGLDVLEITLRTEAALAAIETVRAARPDVLVGAGTVNGAADLTRALAAGAQFLVSPGATPALVEAASAHPEVPWLPGAASVSESLRLLEAGFAHQKLFPAAAVGGVAYLTAIAGPLPEVRFCPTGGIDQDNAAAYLAQPNVLAVGGSWPAPRGLIERGAWREITARARAAAGLGEGSSRKREACSPHYS